MIEILVNFGLVFAGLFMALIACFVWIFTLLEIADWISMGGDRRYSDKWMYVALATVLAGLVAPIALIIAIGASQ